MTQTRNARAVSGYSDFNITPRPRIPLRSNTSPREELFALLQNASEIEEIGKPLIRKWRSPANERTVKQAFLSLQAFVRQAKSFYMAAEALEYRSSALLYYYAFLNLAKAYLVTHSSFDVQGFVGHGLRYKFRPQSLDRQVVTATARTGVFQMLYRSLMDQPLAPSLSLNIKRMLSYCTDIDHEFKTVIGKSSGRIFPALLRIAAYQEQNAWPVLAVDRSSGIEQYRKSLAEFWSFFEKVDYEPQRAYRLFDMDTWNVPGFTFYESIETFDFFDAGDVHLFPSFYIIPKTYEALQPILSPNPYSDEYSFYVALPLRHNLQIPFHEALGIYAVTFFLGSLVRYNPYYIENLLDSKYGRVIERFMKSTPETFLRHIANLILDQDYVLSSR